MSYRKILVYLVIACGLFSVSYSRSVQSEVNKDSNATRNSTIATGSPSSPFDGLTPVVITCAVLLHVFLPFVYWYCYRWCNFRCMDVNLREDEKKRRGTFRENIFVEEEQSDTIFRSLSLHSYFSFILWMVYLICYNVLEWVHLGVVFKNLHIMAIVMMVLCGIYVLLETVISQEFTYMENTMKKDDVLAYIDKMKAEAPVITMSVECYHTERRRRQTSGGGYVTNSEKVVTHEENLVISYDRWEDVSSSEMPLTSSTTLTRLKFNAYFDFGDTDTEEDYEQQKESLIFRNQNRDESMKFKEVKTIPELKQRVLVYEDSSKQIGWIALKYYCLASLFMMTWPYRWLFRAKTAKAYYDMKKKMYKSTSQPPEAILQQTSNLPESKSNPSFAMTELPSSTAQSSLNTAQPPYPGQKSPTNKQPPILADNEGPGYPSEPPVFTAMNQGPASQVPLYPTANQPPPYPSANQGTAFHLNNQGQQCPAAYQDPTFPPLNQGPPFTAANQGPPFTAANQDVPDIPPPNYDQAVDPFSQ